jgi:CheY-like chemotaxis protein
MPRIRLIHWKSSEACAHIHTLDEAGFATEYEEQFRPQLLQSWRESPPDAFVIDLSRLPSHGREIAIALRQYKSTRAVPIVFCGGDPKKVASIRELLPDAEYCTLACMIRTLKAAIARPLADPARPLAMMERYKSRTAAQKLGIKEGGLVAVLNGPRDYTAALGALPADVEVIETDRGLRDAQVHVCFVHRPEELPDLLSRMRPLASHTKLWIAWRKGGKTNRGELNETLVRRQALDLGLVDYKICSLNDAWSALLFALKR